MSLAPSRGENLESNKKDHFHFEFNIEKPLHYFIHELTVFTMQSEIASIKLTIMHEQPPDQI